VNTCQSSSSVKTTYVGCTLIRRYVSMVTGKETFCSLCTACGEDKIRWPIRREYPSPMTGDQNIY